MASLTQPLETVPGSDRANGLRKVAFNGVALQLSRLVVNTKAEYRS